MSSTALETALNVLDATADGVTIVAPAAKPAFKALASLSPFKQLKRGDKAQASTLTILEEYSEVMNVGVHNTLQDGYDELEETRAGLVSMGALKAFRKRKHFVNYATDATQLNAATVTSSQAARSQRMWKKKGVTNRSSSNSTPTQERTPISVPIRAQTDPERADEIVSVDITSMYEDPFRETASVVVPDQASDLTWEPGMAESESICSEPGDIDYDDSFRLRTLRQSDGSQ